MSLESSDRTLAGDGSLPERADTKPLTPGSSVGRYILLDRVGRGAMGTVYAAYDPELDRRVALKLINRVAGKRRELRRERMVREAQAMARLSHPNVVSVYDAGTFERGGEPTVFLAMEFIEGTTLGQWVTAESRPPREALGVLIQAGRGLAAAHRAGLIHRDFKPGNILVRATDGEERPWEAFVTDFGLVRATGKEAESTSGLHVISDSITSGRMSVDLTRTGAHLGTPGYMAPEQFFGQELDARTDQFGFCVTAYEALFGQRPFGRDDVNSLMSAVANGDIREPAPGHKVPARILRALKRGLSPRQSDRFSSMDELLAVLDRAPRPWKRGLAWVAAASAVGAATAGWVVADGEQDCGDSDALLQGAWSSTDRAEVEAAILGTGVPHAGQTWTVVESALDEWAQRWVRVSAAICDGTEETDAALVPRRDACMDDRRRFTVALVDVLRTADGGVADEAITALQNLPTVSECMDAEYLAASTSLPSFERRDEVALLEDDLYRRIALKSAGQLDASEKGLDELRRRTKALAFGRLEARVGWFSGELAQARGNYDEALEDLEKAYARALAVGDDETAANVAKALAQIVGGNRSDTELARHWLLQMDALADRAHLGSAFAFDGDITRANVALARREPTEAVQILSATLQRAQESNTSPSGVAQLRSVLSVAFFDAGNLPMALEHAEAAFGVLAEHLGPEHPKVLDAKYKVGTFTMAAGDGQRGMAIIEKVLPVAARVYGDSSPVAAGAHGNLGVYLAKERRFEEARRHFEESLRQWQQMHGADHPSVIGILENISRLEASMGNDEAAIAGLERILRIRERTQGSEHPDLVVTLVTLAEVEGRLGRFDAAGARLERAAPIASSLDAEQPIKSYVIESLAYIALLDGDLEEAQRQYARAAELARALPDDRYQVGLDSAIGLAKLRARRGDTTQATAELRALLEHPDASSPEGRRRVLKALDKLEPKRSP